MHTHGDCDCGRVAASCRRSFHASSCPDSKRSSGILNRMKMSSIIKARLILSNRFLSIMEEVKA